jgi:hypothetical protein
MVRCGGQKPKVWIVGRDRLWDVTWNAGEMVSSGDWVIGKLLHRDCRDEVGVP